jgi:MFS transporter, DHA1 family, multidrug resistance protein
VLLALVVIAGIVSLWTIVPLVVLTISTMGLVGPAGSARYMSHFSQLAGSASSVYTTLMFSLGGACGWLAGAFFNSSLVPVVGVMLAATCLANLIASTIPKRT